MAQLISRLINSNDVDGPIKFNDTEKAAIKSAGEDSKVELRVHPLNDSRALLTILIIGADAA